MSTQSLAYIITGSGAISGVLNGKAFSIQADFPRYEEVKTALSDKNYDLLTELVDFAKVIKEYGQGKCALENGVVKYNGKAISNVVADRILKLRAAGFPIDSMLRFLENLMQNPLDSAIKELYLFLEKTELPITEDGYFLAYKRVGPNYMDIHAGKFDNSVGKTVQMLRSEVDTNRHNTCSHGLHFCSLSYLPSYGTNAGNHTMIVKINPADVVAIPSDYENAKGRTWKYEVIAEHDKGDVTEAFSEPVVSSDGGKYGTKPSGQKFYQVRDSKGHFVKKS